MKKLYHVFYVSDYKGGELHTNINQSIKDIAEYIDIDWDEISDRCADNEKFSNMSDEEFSSLTCVQLLDMLDDQTLKDIAKDQFYPGNIYAFDSYSDYEIFTTDKNGKLKRVNIIEEPGFIDAFKEALRLDAKWTDKYRKNNE